MEFDQNSWSLIQYSQKFSGAVILIAMQVSDIALFRCYFLYSESIMKY